MAVYYKFKSAKDYDSIPIEGQFISVGNLKERIFESKHLGRGTDFDLMISNAQNNEEYVDEAAMIPKNTSVLIRRIPGRSRRSIVTQRDEPKIIENTSEELPPQSSLFTTSTTIKYPEESEWDEFGNDLYAIPDVPAQSNNPPIDASTASMIDEENKIKALIETPALDWSRQGQDGFGGGRGFGRGIGGRMMSGRGFGRGGPGYERPFERKTPPAGYICHRCKVPGHLIQHCPTNGDPSYDVRKMKPPTGIPKSMLMTAPDGSYSLPSGAVAVLKPNEDAFEKEIQGIPTTRHVGDLPPELRCPLCKEVMKDAVLTSKCCFRSFCDKCIRDYIINNSMCDCGETNTLADDLLPNKTLRETISRIMESTSSAENAGSQAYVQDMESARPMPPKIPSPAVSAASKDEPKKSHTEKSSGLKVDFAKEDDIVSKGKAIDGAEHSLDKNALKTTDPLEAVAESISTKERISPVNASVPEEVQEKVPGDDQGKKKKKKKTRVPGNAADFMQWPGFQNSGAENYGGMPMGPADFNPYWNGGMPMGYDPYMSVPYMGYGPGHINVPFGAPGPFDGSFGAPCHFDARFAQGPFDVPFNGPDPFAAQGYMRPPFPQTRDLSELGYSNMKANLGPPMSREEFEAKKADIRRKRERERLSERDGKGAASNSGANVSAIKEKPRLISRAERPDRSERASSRTASKRRSSEREEPQKPEENIPSSEQQASKPDLKLKGSVFSRISFPGSSDAGAAAKKRKAPDAADAAASNGAAKEHHDRHHDRHHSTHSNGYRKSSYETSDDDDEEEDDDDYHFKRRPSKRRGEREEGRSSRSARDHGHDKRR